MQSKCKDYFDEVADSWDSMRTDFFPEAVRDKAYSKVIINNNTVAVDMGCGSGFITEGLIARGCNVISIDQSPAMLNQIKKKFGKYKKLVTKIGTSLKMPLADNSVDLVFANMYLHHVENPEMAIKEMTRVLKSGGKLIITDLDSHDNEFLRTEQYDKWLGFERADIEGWYNYADLRNISIEDAGSKCKSDSNSCSDHKADISIFIAYGEKYN